MALIDAADVLRRTMRRMSYDTGRMSYDVRCPTIQLRYNVVKLIQVRAL
jgi:hypothetical protein